MTFSASRKDDTVTIRCTYGPIAIDVDEGLAGAQHLLWSLNQLVGEPAEYRAKRGYERYFGHCGGVSVNGEQLPAWEAQREEIRQHWIAAFTE